jgi:hypothetical protein
VEEFMNKQKTLPESIKEKDKPQGQDVDSVK